MYAIDIVQHNLQSHNGSHPSNYDEALVDKLEILENKSKKYCQKKKII